MSRYYAPTDVQASQMEDAVALVQADINSTSTTFAAQGTGVNGVLNGVFQFIGGGQEDAQQAGENAIQLWTSQFTTWSGDDKASVLSGDLSLDNWFATGKALHEAIASTGADVGSWSWAGVTSQTAGATVDEVVAGAKDAITSALPATLGVGVLAGALGVIYLLILFRR